MAEIIKVPTGISGLDQVLGGGIVKGNAVVIQGIPGTGKTTLGLQFINEGATIYDEHGLVISFEETPRQLFRDSKNLGWDLESLVEQKKIQVMATSPQVFQKQLQSTDGTIQQLLRDMKVQRIFVDSVTHFQRITNDPVQLRNLLSSFLNLLREGDYTTLLTQEMRHEEGELSFEQYAVDTVIRLFFEPINRAQRRRFLEVLKARGQSFQSGKHSLEIGTGGLNVYPSPRPGLWTTDNPELDDHPEFQRAESGVPGLDGMLGGGLFEGFSILTAGEGGSGKSTLARMFINHGLNAGENALYVALTEPPEQVIKQCLTIGLDLQPMIDDGRLTILHHPPVNLDANKVFWEVKGLIQSKGFRRAAIDSLTDLEASLLDPDTFRNYVYSLVELFTVNNITSMFTLNVPPMSGENELIESELTMMMDGVFVMRSRNIHDHLRKTITLVKMRGTEHDTGVRQLRISEGEGIVIETGFEGVPSFLRKLQQGSTENA